MSSNAKQLPSTIYSPKSFKWDFWDSQIQFPAYPVFFIVPTRSGDISSAGWWDGKEMTWLAESYHVGDGTIYYLQSGSDPTDMNDVSREEWIDFVRKTTPQCLDWITFHLGDLGLT